MISKTKTKTPPKWPSLSPICQKNHKIKLKAAGERPGLPLKHLTHTVGKSRDSNSHSSQHTLQDRSTAAPLVGGSTGLAARSLGFSPPCYPQAPRQGRHCLEGQGLARRDKGGLVPEPPPSDQSILQNPPGVGGCKWQTRARRPRKLPSTPCKTLSSDGPSPPRQPVLPERTVMAPRSSCTATKWPLLCPHLETKKKLFKATESE